MTTLKLACITLLLSSLFAGQTLRAAPKTYQVTGKVLELTDKMIVVQKGDERWEIAREDSSQLIGIVKVGEKVTIHYRMTAVKIESKLAKGEPSSSEKTKAAKPVSAPKEKTS